MCWRRWFLYHATYLPGWPFIKRLVSGRALSCVTDEYYFPRSDYFTLLYRINMAVSSTWLLYKRHQLFKCMHRSWLKSSNNFHLFKALCIYSITFILSHSKYSPSDITHSCHCVSSFWNIFGTHFVALPWIPC